MLRSLFREVAQAVREVDGRAADALDGGGRIVHLASNWRGRAVYLVFGARGDVPAVVLKVDENPRYQPRLTDEHTRLQAIGDVAALTGSVPFPLALLDVGPRRVLAQSGIAGTPLAVAQRRRLRHGRRSVGGDFALFVQWLHRLQDGSPVVAPVPLDPQHLATRLRDILPREGSWLPLLSRVEHWAAELDGVGIPQVWCHGDLSPGNCLRRPGGLGVIDWEGKLTATDPFVDLVLFLNHYARSTFGADRQLPSERDAFLRAFTGDDWLARATSKTLRAEVVRHGLPADAAPYVLLTTLADLATESDAYVHSAMFRDVYRDATLAYATHLAGDLRRF